jgi:hypothetical protein
VKQTYIGTLALAGALLFGGCLPAMADSFDYSFVSFDGSVTATGTLTGDPIAANEYLITSGSIFITGAPVAGLNGSGLLVSPAPQPFNVGGGTQLIGLDNLFFPNGNPQLDTTGGLAFAMSPGYGVGLGGNGADSYWLFGGNWELNTNGTFSASISASDSAAPEPASLFLFGGGLLAVGFIGRTRLKTS